MNNRIWTTDRLHRHGWPNCNLCPLCQQVQESAAHLLFQCRYTIRIWGMIKTWLVLHNVQPNDWIDMVSVKDWWSQNATKQTPSRRPLVSLMMLISWEIWKERNARVFRNTAVPVGVLVAKIKEECSLWSLAGAKHLCNIMLREWCTALLTFSLNQWKWQIFCVMSKDFDHSEKIAKKPKKSEVL